MIPFHKIIPKSYEDTFVRIFYPREIFEKTAQNLAQNSKATFGSYKASYTGENKRIGFGKFQFSFHVPAHERRVKTPDKSEMVDAQNVDVVFNRFTGNQRTISHNPDESELDCRLLTDFEVVRRGAIEQIVARIFPKPSNSTP